MSEQYSDIEYDREDPRSEREVERYRKLGALVMEVNVDEILEDVHSDYYDSMLPPAV